MFGNKKCTKIHFFANKFAYMKKKQYLCRPKWKKWNKLHQRYDKNNI